MLSDCFRDVILFFHREFRQLRCIHIENETTFSLDNSLVIIADFDAISLAKHLCLLFGFSIDQTLALL
jgi:hypothetical protein